MTRIASENPYVRCYHLTMKELHQRLTWARETAGFKTRSDFARHANIPVSTYIGYENGSRAVNPKLATKLSKSLHVDAGWLLTGIGAARKNSNVSPVTRSVRWAPVVSWVHAGRLGDADLNADADYYVPVTTDSDTVAAFEVRGTSMNRVAPPKSVIVVDGAQRMAEDGWAVMALVGSEVTFKRYRDTNGPIRLEPDSTEHHETMYPAEGFEILGRVVQVITKL